MAASETSSVRTPFQSTATLPSAAGSAGSASEIESESLLAAPRHPLHHVSADAVRDFSRPQLPSGSILRRARSQVSHYNAHRGMTVGAAMLTHAGSWHLTVRPAHPPPRAPLRRVVFLGLAFMVMFSAYNVAQTNLTSIFPNVGFYSFALTFSMFALGSLVAPALGQLTGIVNAMGIGAATYTGLVAMFLSQSDTGILIMSPITGFGGAMLWIHQGIWLTYVTELSGANGYFTGIFFFIYNLNMLIGNALVLVISACSLSTRTLEYIWTGIMVAGTALIFVAPAPTPPEKIQGPLKHVQHVSLREWMRELKKAAKQPWTQLLAVYMAEQGITNAFSIGVLPALTSGSVTAIAYLFLAYGGAGCVASLVSGHLFDRWGWQWLVGLQVGSTVVVHALVLGVYYGGVDSQWYILCCGVASLADNFVNSINNMTISKMYAHDSSPAFSLYRLVYCAGLAVASIIASNVTVVVIVILCLASTFLAALAYIALRLHHMPPGCEDHAPCQPADHHADHHADHKLHAPEPSPATSASDAHLLAHPHPPHPHLSPHAHARAPPRRHILHLQPIKDDGVEESDREALALPRASWSTQVSVV